MKTYEKHRAFQTQELTALIKEKQLQLERLQIQLDSLARTEGMQAEFLEQFMLQK